MGSQQWKIKSRFLHDAVNEEPGPWSSRVICILGHFEKINKAEACHYSINMNKTSGVEVIIQETLSILKEEGKPKEGRKCLK